MNAGLRNVCTHAGIPPSPSSLPLRIRYIRYTRYIRCSLLASLSPFVPLPPPLRPLRPLRPLHLQIGLRLRSFVETHEGRRPSEERLARIGSNGGDGIARSNGCVRNGGNGIVRSNGCVRNGGNGIAMTNGCVRQETNG